MERLPLTTFPEIQERLVYPVMRPKLGPTHSPFTVQNSESSPDSSRSTGPNSTRRSRTQPTVSISAGGRVIEEQVSGRHLPGKTHKEFIPCHVYSARHSFGHLLPANDMNPFLAHSRIPVFSRTSDEIGRHYLHHSHQKFLRGSNFRLPLPPGISTTVADRFRAQTSLMFQ